LSADVNLDTFSIHLEGFSGADIKYICDRAATIPFLHSVATGQEGDITTKIISAAINDAPKSVTREMLQRFDQWSATAATG
jgi:SpoVK/Ycf46/Vps4 family AAA+-type ATPase